MKDLTLAILAAGLGSRFGGPKQIEPLGPNGEILMDYSLYDAQLAGFSKVVFIVKEDFKSIFHETIGKRIEKKMLVDYAIQGMDTYLSDWFSKFPQRGQKPWGTAHAVLCCKDKIDSDFVVINADDFYGRKSFQLLADYMRKPHADTNTEAFCMAGYVLKNTLSENGFVTRGICEEDEHGCLAEINERPKIGYREQGISFESSEQQPVSVSGDSTVSMNIWGFTPKVFSMIEAQKESFFKNIKNIEKDEFLLPLAVDHMIKENLATVKILKTDAKWHGITYKEDKPKVCAALKQMHDNGTYPSLK